MSNAVDIEGFIAKLSDLDDKYDNLTAVDFELVRENSASVLGALAALEAVQGAPQDRIESLSGLIMTANEDFPMISRVNGL